MDTLDPGTSDTIEEFNKEYAERVLDLYGGNKSKAAGVLGISRTSLWRILGECGVNGNRFLLDTNILLYVTLITS